MAMPVMSGFAGGVVGGRPQGQQGAAQSEWMRKATPPAPSLKQATSAPQNTKVDAVIAAVIQRVTTGGRPGVDEARFVFGDQAYIKITVRDTSPAAIEQLRNAGLVVTKVEGNVVSGHVALAKLEGVSRLPMVTWIGPR